MSAPSAEADRALSARSVSKRFGATQALSEVDLHVTPGRIHALVGENGAGKSTLAKILAGIEAADSGSMAIGDTPYSPRDRADAKARGVNMVPQHLSLVGELSLVENLLLVSPRRLLRRRWAEALLKETLERAGVAVEVSVPVQSLTQAHRQLGEIVVALAEGATILILDEPTASLGPHEVGGLFSHLRALCELGTAIVLITHRVDEVGSVADDVSVLSHGRLVHHGPARDLDAQRIAHLMVGDLPPVAARPKANPGEVMVSLESVSADSGSDAPVTNLDLVVRSGEVLGLAGVAGSGQNTVLDVIAGLATPTAGHVRVGDRRDGDAVEVLRDGLAWIPEERSEGIVPQVSLADTLYLYDSAVGATARKGRKSDAGTMLRSFDVRPSDPATPAGSLSGGNQQKLLVARELGAVADGAPRVVLAYGPTQGLDLRAAQAIRERLVAAARSGAAVLVASHDLEELTGVADRIAVMYSGRLVADWPIDDVTPRAVGAAMAGLTETKEHS